MNYIRYYTYRQTNQKYVCNNTDNRLERNSKADTVFLVVLNIIVMSSRHNGQNIMLV